MPIETWWDDEQKMLKQPKTGSTYELWGSTFKARHIEFRGYLPFDENHDIWMFKVERESKHRET